MHLFSSSLYLTTIIIGASTMSPEIENHLEMGKKLLSQGQYQDALSHYHAAVDGDPNNYMTYFRRATVYLAIGRSKSALPDLAKVIELKPDFIQARSQRANVLMKQGKLAEARLDYESVLKINPENEELKANLDSIGAIEEAIKTAEQLKDGGDAENAIQWLSRPIELCPWDPKLRIMRSECYLAMGDYIKAMGDMRSITKLVNDPTEAHYKLSTLHYQMGELDEALREVRECLKLDPDHKLCYPHYKTLKKLDKQFKDGDRAMEEGRFDDALDKYRAALKTEPTLHHYVVRSKTQICNALYKLGQLEEAFTACTEAIEEDEFNIDALCDRAEIYITREQYDEAIGDYQKAKQVEGHPQKVEEGFNRAQKLLKQSQKRDYYKILGVKRTATKNQILKAYRKLAVKWHPDRYKGEDKKMAEKKFIEVAAAKEVLSDDEKRQKFDNGEDPLDPEGQQGGGGWNFHQGGFPFGGGGGGGGNGGPFQFKFHFG
ncbi:dnaJ homolog subfamily C member 3-like [Oscarella lobularis]|uniref:dnaJ homolog subfamily C member 3-like n=1 Tax=Oscarella lobularis TaxID=121494 RepID=UPI003313FCFD